MGDRWPVVGWTALQQKVGAWMQAGFSLGSGSLPSMAVCENLPKGLFQVLWQRLGESILQDHIFEGFCPVFSAFVHLMGVFCC